MSLVVDASVAVKWIVAEDGHATALSLPDVSSLVAPDFVLVETSNVMWKKVRRGEMAAEQMTSGLAFLQSAFSELVPQIDLIGRAVQLSIVFDHPVYDCLYVACAEAKGCDLLTADAKLASKFADQRVRLLGTLP